MDAPERSIVSPSPNYFEAWLMDTKFVTTLVSVAVIASLLAIIGVFGVLPAFATLMVFIAIACVLAVRPERL